MARTLVIAEPGATHEGDRAKLFALLETAHACGADVFKPQWTSDPIAMCERRHIGAGHPRRAYYQRAYSWLNFPLGWHGDLRDRCHALGMEYACTVFLPQDVWPIAHFLDRIKIASFEGQDQPLIKTAQAIGIPVLVSAGMREIGQHEYLGQTLHCVSAYPAPLEAMNLRVLGRNQGEGWGYQGLSDHSRCLITGALAVACGAETVETHFRLDDCDPENPDYAVAFTPAEFTQYIQNIRDAEAMLGDGVKRIQPCEEWALPYRVTG